MGAQTGVTLAANSARGNADGQDLTHSNTHVEAGNVASLASGGDTTLQGAVVAGHTVHADVGGNLAIESLQDVSTYTSRQRSVGGSITIGPSPGASISASRGNIDSTYASVVEQSGIQAGDGGYQVRVNGNTDLKGGVIASSDAAIAQGANRFDGAGTLTQSDIVNSAAYTARSSGISVGTGGATVKGVGIGMGSDSGNQATVTRSGIGVASSTDTAAAIRPIFDAVRVQAEVGAQAAITQAFTLEAPKAVAHYAGSKAQELKTQARQAANAGDDRRAHELNEEAAKWEEGGRYRGALHTVAGALGGGVSGAAGAAASAGTAELMNELQDSTQAVLQEAGLSVDAARMVAQGVAGLAAAGVGAAIGGGQGAATALTVDANNRQLHPDQIAETRRRARQLAGQDGLSAEQWEERLNRQLLRQNDSAYAGNSEDAQARAILADIQNSTGISMTAQGTRDYANHALNSQYLGSEDMRDVYNRAGLPPNISTDGRTTNATKALIDAARDWTHLSEQPPQVRLAVLQQLSDTLNRQPDERQLVALQQNGMSAIDAQRYRQQTQDLGNTLHQLMVDLNRQGELPESLKPYLQVQNRLGLATAVSGILSGYLAGRGLNGGARPQTVNGSLNGRGLGSAADNIYTSTRPMEEVFPELRGVNPHYVENAPIGVNTNCVSCANVAQQRLTGSNSTAVADAPNGYAGPNALLQSAPFGFQPVGFAPVFPYHRH